MNQYIVAYAITAAFFLVVDFVWLSKVAKSFYLERLGEHLRDSPNMGAAGAFYAIYVVGLLIFAVFPGLRSDSITTALVYGALFGFFTYATYDMTNYATLKNWPVSVVFIDIAWGTFLAGSSAAVGAWGTRLAMSSG